MGGVRSIAAVSSVFAVCVTTERLVCLAVRSIILSVNVQTERLLCLALKSILSVNVCYYGTPGLSCCEIHTVCTDGQ